MRLICSSIFVYRHVQHNDLFKPHQKCAAPNRVILQGEPGIGKSTVCQKLAFDWSKLASNAEIKDEEISKRETSHHYLNSFKFLFYLHARDMKASLCDSIFDHILPEDLPVSKEDFQKYIELHQRETLFIIDGFDEINKEGKDIVQKLVQRRLLPHCTVLLTSRPQYAMHLLRYFDSQFEVNGYSEERMDEFIKKYSSDMAISIETFDSLKKCISNYHSMKDICRNPLNLCFLCILCEERKGVLPRTRTEIYDEIFEMLLQKAAARLDIPMETLDWHLKQLCELAFNGLKQNVFSFPASQFTCEDVLSSMGFLNKELPMSRLKNPTVYYVFTHTSFQEYLGARHVSSLPLNEKKETLFKYLRGRHMSAMWGFYCGMNRNNEPNLLEYFSAFDEQFCPMVLDRSLVTGSGHGARFHMPRSMPFHRLSVQDITSGLHIQLFKCLKEIDLTNLSAGTLEVISKCVPCQISFSHIYTSKTALTGFLNFLNLKRANKQYQLVVSSDIFRDPQENAKICRLFKEIAKSGQVSSVGLHMVTCSSEVIAALETFDFNKSFSATKCLKLKFMNFVRTSDSDIQDLNFGHGLECLEIYDCNIPDLLTRILQQVAVNSADLRKLVIQNCAMNQIVLAKLASVIKSKDHLTHLEFSENHIDRDNEMAALPLLAVLEARKPTLTSLSVSGLPSRQSWQPDSLYCSHTAQYIKNILLKNKIEHLNMSKTVLHKNILEALVTFVQQGNVKVLEIEFCFIICLHTFNLLLKSLGDQSELRHFSIKGSTMKLLRGAEVSPPSDMSFLEVNSMTSRMSQLSPRPLSPRSDGEGSGGTRSRRILRSGGDFSPPRFRFVPQTYGRALSVPEGMQDKVVMSTINNARIDERTASVHIIHGLLEKTVSLQSLVISDLHADQLICLCKGLENNKSLLSVALLCSNFSEPCTTALCKFLEKHPAIQELSFARSNINSIDHGVFFQSVAKCKTLRTLALRHCLFHDKHMKLLAEAVDRNSSIRNVLLRDNSRVTCEGARVFYDGLKGRAQQLRILDLSDCKITKDDDIVKQLKEIALVVKVNWF